jgi:hypothetical protein
MNEESRSDETPGGEPGTEPADEPTGTARVPTSRTGEVPAGEPEGSAEAGVPDAELAAPEAAPASGPPAGPLESGPAPWTGPAPVPVPARRSRVGIAVAIAAVVAVVLGLGTVVLVSAAVRPAATNRAVAVSPSPSPSPSKPPVSPEEYQQALTTDLTPLGPAFAELAATRTPAEIRAAGDKLRDAVGTAENQLGLIVAPPAVRTPHYQLVGDLSLLGSTIGTVQNAAATSEVCAGSSALARVTGSPEAGLLRDAIKALATTDPAHPYTTPAFLPAASAEAERQLANGTVIKKTTKGANELKVVNGDTLDTVVSLQANGTTGSALMFYVRAGQTATVNGIHDGTYTTYLTTGKDWDPTAKVFTRDCSYQVLSGGDDYTSTSRTYTIRTLTLQAATGGNTVASNVDPGAFPG